MKSEEGAGRREGRVKNRKKKKRNIKNEVLRDCKALMTWRQAADVQSETEIKTEAGGEGKAKTHTACGIKFL